MGSLARPGPQQGGKGPPAAHRSGELGEQGFGRWFWGFLKGELAPYPGRWTIVLRMVAAATLTMMLIMTFRLPGAAIAAFYTLLLSRDSPNTTFQSAVTVVIAYAAGAVYMLLCAMLFVDYPLTHFLWVVFSLFLCFFAIRVVSNYVGGAALAFVITIALPIWDVSLRTELLVVGTLWSAGSVTIGLAATVAIEYLFAMFQAGDELQSGLTARMKAVSDFLSSYPSDGEAGERILQFATVGVSRLRRLATSSAAEGLGAARRNSTISLVGRLVDLSATVVHLRPSLSEEDLTRLQRAAKRLAGLEGAVADDGTDAEGNPMTEPTPSSFSLLPEIERSVGLLALNLVGRPEEGAAEERPITPAQPPTFAGDAFSNREYLSYALRGCLAATLCYVLFNAIAWRGISTSLATCVITALTSVGTSRQKQLLRFAGAAVGGIVFGIGSQVWILPHLDTIAGFTVLFATVTLVAAWFATCSPRLSYFGQQIALAFYLINLQEFFPQTNLGIARDRVVGIALGLGMMWLVFDTLGSKPAVQVMREIFATNLRLLARLSEPWKDGQAADLKSISALRDQISANFGSVNSQADGVLFEVGASRQRDLAERAHLLDWQPQLRSLFSFQVALLQYRIQVSPQELAPAIREAQQALDRAVHDSLETLAEAFQQKRRVEDPQALDAAYARLESAIRTEYDPVTPRANAILSLSAAMRNVLEKSFDDLQ